MTEKADTQVDSALDSQKSDTPEGDSQPQQAQAQTETPQQADETRTEEQVEHSISFQQSRADTALNTVKDLETKIEKYKNLDVLDTQLNEDDRFQQDLNGAWSLKTPQTEESQIIPDDYATNDYVGRLFDEKMKPLMQSLGLLVEQNKAKEMGIEFTQDELIRAGNTPISAAQTLEYYKLKAKESTSHQDGADAAVKSITGQIQHASEDSATIANTNSIAEPVEEPKTEDEKKNDGIKSAIRGMNSSTMDIIHSD